MKTKKIFTKKIKREKGKKQEKQLKWIFILMGILVLVLLFSYVALESARKFEYAGLKFEKIMYDKLPLYYSRIPIKNIYGNIVTYYNMYLRNDPRKLRDIAINGSIRLMKNSIVSVDDSIKSCSDNGVAGVSLGTFLKAAGINMSFGYTNETIAKEKNMSYAICNNSLYQSVIIIKQTNKTEITQESLNCYSINFNNCEIIKAVERFMIATVAHSKGIEV